MRQSAPADPWPFPAPLLPAICALALLACFAATLGGVSDGTVRVGSLFNVDSAYGYKWFQSIFLSDTGSSGFRLSTSPMLFPDMLLFSWPLYALGMGWFPVLHISALLQAVFGAVGWMLVCARLGGGWTSRCGALLAWAAQMLGMAYGADIFVSQAHSGLHFGAWACAPWLLWLALPDEKEGLPTPRLAALALALAVCVGSDLLLVPWFTAPAGAAASLLFLLRRWSAARAAKFLVALALGTVGGMLLRDGLLLLFTSSVSGESYTSFHPERSGGSALSLARFFAYAASERRLLSLVWLAFVGLTLFYLFRAAPRKSRESNGRIFAAVYMPAAMIFTLLAIIAVGNVHEARWGYNLWLTTRYFTPVIFLPAFCRLGGSADLRLFCPPAFCRTGARRSRRAGGGHDPCRRPQNRGH